VVLGCSPLEALLGANSRYAKLQGLPSAQLHEMQVHPSSVTAIINRGIFDLNPDNGIDLCTSNNIQHVNLNEYI